ncbi:MAG: metal-dependent hydrolase [Confluentimicrobium sp.]|uniref:endonuclease/exonuclease/phosphatase family protein n=1 Tax=Actibacterium sp. TaxID=1872125 RepID=UPI000C48990A|nr:endonuclease/exonuclease/phosphatase family protein [Actibacterium sp.]MBC57776.1 metal-dependent hydrolase [Actibacterium sp.]
MNNDTLRLASYNIRKCLGLDLKRAPGRVMDVINGIDADIIVLQEADKRLGPRPAALPARMIEAHSDFTPVALDDTGVSLGFHGNAVLMREGTHVTAIERLDLPGLEPRGAALVDITRNGREMRVVAVHLGLLRRSRQRQLAAIRAALSHKTPLPTVILGDFNEWSRDRGMAPLADAFTVHAPGSSFHASRPVAALDRIALCNRLALRDAGVAETALSRRASDHLPIWADLEISGAPAAG